MREKEKMINGELYNPQDLELASERKYAKIICHQYNNISPENFEDRKILITKFFYKTGKNFVIEPNIFCDYGYNIEIGEKFYSNHNLVILDSAKVKFGDNVLIGPNCGFYTVEHPLNVSIRNSGLEFAKPINVGNNVWFGGNVTVLGGVTIGDNCVIGAGSVVIKDVDQNCVVAGNPAKIIKRI